MLSIRVAKMDRLGPKDRVMPRCLARKRLVTARLDKNRPEKNCLDRRPDSKTATLLSIDNI